LRQGCRPEAVIFGRRPKQDAQQYTSQQRQGEAALRSAQNAIVATARQLAVLNAQRSNAEANLAQATAQRDQAKLNLAYTIVTAAQRGASCSFPAPWGNTRSLAPRSRCLCPTTSG
jgi:septal ring factor EnvC (AmiA/AmiB activator)